MKLASRKLAPGRREAMRANNTPGRRFPSTDEFLKKLDDVPLVARRGDRYRYGRGLAFAAKYRQKGWDVFFKDRTLYRELGEVAYAEGGLRKMNEVWHTVQFHGGIIIGRSWDGIPKNAPPGTLRWYH